MKMADGAALAEKAAAVLNQRAEVVRWVLGGPLAIVIAVLTMAAMPLWLPTGAAGVDHLVFPIVLFPAIWAMVFFYVVLETSPARATVVCGGALVLNTALVAASFMGSAA